MKKGTTSPKLCLKKITFTPLYLCGNYDTKCKLAHMASMVSIKKCPEIHEDNLFVNTGAWSINWHEVLKLTNNVNML